MAEAIEDGVTLALPCYNESENITTVLEQSVRSLEGLGMPWEILVIDNCSCDTTADVVRAFASAESRVRLVVHEQNRLYSGSCATALRESRGRYVAIMDSDGQFTADDLPAFLARLRTGANLVFGWRRRRRDPLFRKGMSLVFNSLGKFWLGFPLHDLNVGIRMFDRTFMAAASIHHAINMANPEFYVRARRAGLVLDEVPIRHFERTKGTTSHNLTKFVQLFLKVNRYFRDLGRELRAPLPANGGCEKRASGAASGRR